MVQLPLSVFAVKGPLPRWQILSTLAIVVALLFVLLNWRRYREDLQLENLIFEANTSPDSAARSAAIRQISSIPSNKATEALLSLANMSAQNGWPDVPESAVAALSKRKGNPIVGARLAELLQPHVSLGTRRSVAKALSVLQCYADCISLVLHYRERRWYGEATSELQRGMDKEGVRSDEQEITRRLDSVLVREEDTTLGVLAKVYGLGSLNPSRFAIATVRELGLKKSCIALQYSVEAMT